MSQASEADYVPLCIKPVFGWPAIFGWPAAFSWIEPLTNAAGGTGSSLGNELRERKHDTLNQI
jgi:hypothetical protein